MTTETDARLQSLAPDLAHQFPRSPRATLAGYVIAARMLDKCRAVLAGTAGEYHFDCGLDRIFLEFSGIDAEEFKAFVATGAPDEEVARFIEEKATPRPRLEIIKWNNAQREARLSDLPDQAQEYMEDYVAKVVPAGKVVYHWFDVYDYEEGRL